jgi:hypothetical protein
MPLHDWTRVDAGIFHDFHLAWIAELRRALNGGLLPPGYYALAEPVAGSGNPDVLALREPSPGDRNGRHDPTSDSGGTALLTAPPQTRLVARADRENYTARQRQISIRHTSGDDVVALVEIVSAGNKSSTYAWDTFCDKLLGALRQGVHLLVLDLHPPTPRDASGLHGHLWEQLTGDPVPLPPDADRTLAAYTAGAVKMAFVEPTAVGQPLRAMPLYLTPEGYVEVPLEATYLAAYAGVPPKYRRVLDAPAGLT